MLILLNACTGFTCRGVHCYDYYAIVANINCKAVTFEFEDQSYSAYPGKEELYT